MSEILILGVAIAAFIGIFALLVNWSERQQIRRMQAEADRLRARQRRQEEAERQRLAMLVEWDDGLDVSKLEVRHEPTRGE